MGMLATGVLQGGAVVMGELMAGLAGSAATASEASGQDHNYRLVVF